MQIVHFGLLPEYHGRGRGKFLLTAAVEEAWRSGATVVRVNSCALDAPAALPNYLQRGFAVYRTERYTVK